MTNTVIQLKSSGTSSATPPTLANGEIALNYADGKLFYKDTAGNIQEISGGGNTFSIVNAAGTLLVADLPSDILNIQSGNNIEIVGDALTDSLTITANLKAAFDIANAAFDKANTGGADLSPANAYTNVSVAAANNYAGFMANSANAYAASLTPDLSPAFNKANDAYKVANSAYDNANSILVVAQAAFDRANLSNDVLYVASAYDTANAAYNKANSANVLAYDTGIGANNYAGFMANSSNAYAESIGSSSNAYANLVGTSGNNYTIVVGASGNNYTNTVGSSSNNYSGFMSNASNAWANTKLSNTSGVVFDGNLTISTDLTIGNNIPNVKSIIFNTSTNRIPGSPGELTWSQDDSTLHFNMDSPSSVVGHIGQDVFYYVKNQTGSTISKGSVVRFAGTLGASGRLLVAPAIANNSYPSKYVMGVAAADITTGSDGFVISQGKIRGLNTSMFSAGDILYVSPSTPGGFSNTMPSAPNNKITIAAVVNSDNIQGVIEVRVALGSKINEDELAELNGLTDGDVLSYVSANGRFENKDTLTTVYKVANSGFDKANTANTLAYNTGIGANAYTDSVGASSNSYTRTFANTVGDNANTYAGVMANSANAYAAATYSTQSSLSTGLASVNAYANTVGTSSNSYADSVGTSTNNYTSATYATITTVATNATSANNYAGVMSNGAGNIANSAFAAANQAGVVANNANTYAGSTYVKKAGDTITGDLVVQGNVTISGQSTYANTQTLLIGDNIITLNNDLPAAVAPSEDAGIEVNRGSSANVSVLWKEGNDNWTLTNDGTTWYSIATNNDIASVNSYANTVSSSANNYAGQMANSSNGYASATYATQTTVATNATSANNYAGFMANSSNAYAAATYATTVNAAAAFDKANNALANTSGVSFDGSLYFPTGNIGIGRTDSGYKLDVVGTINASAVLVNGAPLAGGGGAEVSAIAPSSPTANSLWWNSTYGRLFIYYNDGDTSQWVDANPATDYRPIWDSANAAFTVANNVYTVANTANAAYVVANASYSTSNAAYTTANAGFDTANSASLTANASYTSTNASFTVANAAYTAANSAASTGKAIAMAIVFGG